MIADVINPIMDIMLIPIVRLTKMFSFKFESISINHIIVGIIVHVYVIVLIILYSLYPYRW